MAKNVAAQFPPDLELQYKNFKALHNWNYICGFYESGEKKH